MKNDLLTQFASQFAEASLHSLIKTFNAEVGNHGWASARAAHNYALIEELIRRGVDVSAIHDGHSTRFAHAVKFDETAMKLIIQE